MSPHIELIRADRYYHRRSVGWVVLVGGRPLHYTGPRALIEAKEFINARNKRAYREESFA